MVGKRTWAKFSSALVLGWMGSLVACTPTTQPPTQTPAPVAFECIQFREPEPTEATAFFVQGQLIVLGPGPEIDAVVEGVRGQGIELELVEDCDLGYLDRFEGERGLDPERFPLPPNERLGADFPALGAVAEERALALRLYSIGGGETVPEVVQVVNEVGSERGVFADPNYLAGPLAISPCGDPFEVGGSPFEVGGSPFEVGGSPGAGLGAEADAGVFWEQWAFDQIDLGPVYQKGEWERRGEGIRVGVFDTSPYETEGAKTVSTANQVFPLNVVHTLTINQLSPVDGAADVREHGVFVAGLANAVASGAQLHLYRVLNEYGCGDLMTLHRALNAFFAAMSDEGGRLDGVVVNLSLGVHQPREPEGESLPGEVVSLEHLLHEAFLRGAVVVAAAGNDSAGLREPATTNLPAAYPFVIGVAADNVDVARACYSNVGDLAAPGAEGRAAVADACEPRADTCLASDAGCPLGVVSLSPSSSTGYRFWVGTSFATPLVSGLAALAYEAAGDSPGVYNLIQSGVMATADPSLGWGVINVSASMSP